MSKAPKFSAELHKLCGKLRDGDITQAQAQRLGEMLRENRGARRFYRTFMALASALETRTSLQGSVDHENDSDKNIEVLFELLHMEQEAEVLELPAEPFVPKTKPRRSREHSLGWHEFADASGYLVKQAAKSTPAKWLAAAAVVALSVLLALQFIGPGTPQDPAPIVNNTTTKPAESVRPILRDQYVATLTATHNAVWESPQAEGALAPGSKLHPKDRLILTAGFAEITTNDGAIAILEAPATIELIDNNNALRLHSGKLVGICETELSKGFLVRTPHMDVIDLGTRFGIDATLEDKTQVHVFDGEVQVRSSAPSQEDVSILNLLAGRAVVSSEAQGLADAAYDEHRFVPGMVAASLVPDFAGTNAVWLGQVTGDLRQGKRRADELQVFIEQPGLLLKQNVSVEFNREHPWDAATTNKRYDVPAGERIDVYLVHFDLLNGHDKPEHFAIDFGRPILGVIVSQAALNETDAVFGVAGVTYPVFGAIQGDLLGGLRGLNYRVYADDDDASDPLALMNDLATISADGTRLNLRLWGGDNPAAAKMDQVRVLVRSDPAARNTPPTHPTGDFVKPAD